MAFVLVRWTKEDRMSVIPVAWVVNPSPVPAHFPVKGMAYWRKKTHVLEAILLAVSGTVKLLSLCILRYLP